MGRVRVLVGTKKGAFVLSSDGARKSWEVSGPSFPGREVYHVKGSPADPSRIYAASSGWGGHSMHRSEDGGLTWDPVSSEFSYEGETGTHRWYDGSAHPWEFARVWHLEPSLTDPDTVWAGVEDAALFRSRDGGDSWHEMTGFRNQPSASKWGPGAGGMCLHTILLDQNDHNRMFAAVSAAGAFRSLDGGESWAPINRGLQSAWELADPEHGIGHCVHNLAMHPDRPEVLYMQKHWDVARSQDGGGSWHEVSGNLPSDFGFAIEVNANNPDTEHYPPDGKLRVYRSDTGGEQWEALTSGLPQDDCYVNVLRDAMAVDQLDPCGVYFGTTGGQVFASANDGDDWEPIVGYLPSVLSVEVQTLV